MKFWSRGTRRNGFGAGVLAATLLAACGGGQQVERFVPSRLVVFGDESSVINNDGSKYTVNALVVDTTTLDCKANPIWVQTLALAYGLEFAQCPNTGAAVNAVLFATAGAKVADISAQIDAAGAFGGKDLVTVLAGATDVIDQYGQYNTIVNGVLQTEAVLIANLEAAGTALALQVNRIADAGGKVLISTVPDMGLTPFAVAEEVASAGRAALLSRLTKRFNAKLRNNITNDGRRIGLLLTDELVQAVVNNPGASAFVNANTAVCDAALAPAVTGCTTATLIAGGSGETYLWANDRLLSPGGHRLLGQLALARASGNPF